ncbi:E-cinnamoyl-CoA:R-phenyllactate CoA transferase [Microbacterium oxydans]|uniref:E-cinnamoyl-CoA:R-phenyllactate CoA transferase n=2 Tax=Microbacterium oxydans TaxID=82380 RepID=A0A0F0KUE4_9MICO|nr:E-cinnamoyl-CoA:R-phenyllactate CoA transferase [Microbacterium oxydans]
MLARMRQELGLSNEDDAARPVPVVPPLPSRLATADLAWASVGAVMLAAGRSPASLDPERIAVAYRSDRVLTIDGLAPPVWSEYSGFWRAADGWVRTHGNYPHHAAALRAGLGLGEGAGGDLVRDALAERASLDAVSDITAAGGLAVVVAAEDPAVDHVARARPLLEISRPGSASGAIGHHIGQLSARSEPLPLRGMRVLDLTRVIAGPVCTRTLALLGADVLRIDPPRLPEPQWQHLDTGHGKRSAVWDARSSELHDLLARADAVVLGYRPAALDRLGLNPDLLMHRHPGLVVAQLSAWGTEHPERAGFDSLVQAESGISLIESVDGDRPGALPAQALDHSAGYLLAAAVTTRLRHHPRDERSCVIRTSLRRVAAELLGMPRRAVAEDDGEFDVRRHTARFDVDGSTVVTARPALAGLEFAAPHAWGSDQPVW